MSEFLSPESTNPATSKTNELRGTLLAIKKANEAGEPKGPDKNLRGTLAKQPESAEVGPDKPGKNSEMDPVLKEANGEIAKNIAKVAETSGTEGVKNYINNVLEGKDPSVSPSEKEALYKYLARGTIELSQKNVTSRSKEVLSEIERNESSSAEKSRELIGIINKLGDFKTSLRRVAQRLEAGFSPDLMRKEVARELASNLDRIPKAQKVNELANPTAIKGNAQNFLNYVQQSNSRMIRLSSTNKEMFDSSGINLRSYFSDAEITDFSKDLAGKASEAKNGESNPQDILLDQINSQDTMPGYENFSKDLIRIIDEYLSIPDLTQDRVDLMGRNVQMINRETSNGVHFRRKDEFDDYYQIQGRRITDLEDNFIKIKTSMDKKERSLQDIRLLSLELSKLKQ